MGQEPTPLTKEQIAAASEGRLDLPLGPQLPAPFAAHEIKAAATGKLDEKILEKKHRGPAK
ncbi:MAG TPA: hypothetical protein VF101_12760 [Gaiellaceae bacterium]